jgi:hypothetical protein
MYIPLKVQPTDCETCGTSYDELTVEFDDDGAWEGRLSVGCYGGGEIVGTRAEVVGWLRSEAADLVEADVLEDAISKIESA